MRKPISNQNIFEVVKKQQSQARPAPPIPKETPAASTQAISQFDPALWQQQVLQMQGELDTLKEQLKRVQKEMGIPLDQLQAITQQLSAGEQLILNAHQERRQRDLDKLIVLPSFLAERTSKAARQEKRERTNRVVGTRKQWISVR